MLKRLLDSDLYNKILTCVHGGMEEICEIRLRESAPVVIKTATARIVADFCANAQNIKNIVTSATDYSVYAHQDEIMMGYIACAKGVRIGVCGSCVTSGDKLVSIKDISSVCVRIPHRVPEIKEQIIGLIDSFENTLVVSPPFCGKTTLIREMVALLAEKYDVVVIDERGEISANGYFDLGKGVDVICGAPKEMVYEGVIRGMGADIIVMDELSPGKDLKVVEKIATAGVKMIASVHGEGGRVWIENNKALCEGFSSVITLSNKPKVGSIKSLIRSGRG